MKVTIGELLGIAKQAKALNWEDLATQFKKVEKINALKNTAVSELSTTFSTVLNGFSIGKQVANVIQQAKPIINMAVKIAGLVKNWAYAGDIANELLLLAQKLILELAMTTIGQIRDYILAIEIDLGNLTADQLKTLRDKIAKTLNDSYSSLNESLNSLTLEVLYPDIALFLQGVNSLYTELSTTELSVVLDQVAGSVEELGQGILLDLENITGIDLSKLNNVVYGQNTTPLTGVSPSYVDNAKTSYFSTDDIDLNKIANPQGISDGDQTWKALVADDNDISRELMDAITKTINGSLNNLLNNLANTLKGLTVNINDIEKDIFNNNENPEYDIEALNKLKDGFLSYIQDSQFALCKSALQQIFKLNDSNLKKLINLFLKGLRDAYTNRANLLNKLLEDYINSLTETNVEAARALIYAYLQMLQGNLEIDAGEIYRKILFEYLSYIFDSMSVDNEERNTVLITKALNKFYDYRRDFLLNIIEKIKRIRLQNDTIDEDYYLYSFETLKQNILDITEEVLSTANAITYDGSFKYDGSMTYGANTGNIANIKEELTSRINLAISDFVVTITENTEKNDSNSEIASTTSESIPDKVNIFKANIYKAINTIVEDEPLPDFIWTDDEWLNVTDQEKEMLKAMVTAIFFDYKRRLMKIIENALYKNKYSTIKMMTSTVANALMNDYSTKQIIIFKSRYSDMFDFIATFPYNNDLEQFKLDISDRITTIVNEYNYSLEHSFKFASLLKQQEIDFIREIVIILSSS